LQKGRELFIDTTYLLPFLQIPIRSKGFNLSDFRKFMSKLSRVHVSELSVYEAKAKLLRMSRSHGEYDKMLSTFGENLNVLRADEKFAFRSYTEEADRRFNQLVTVAKRLDAFDLIILCEASTVGDLLTEDTEILSLRDSHQFAQTPPFNSMKIRSWIDVRPS
jgi:hypothetical protein